MKCNDISHSCGSKKVFVCVRKKGEKERERVLFLRSVEGKKAIIFSCSSFINSLKLSTVCVCVLAFTCCMC